MENPAKFDEKQLKKAMNEKLDVKMQRADQHEKYIQLDTMIENAKQGWKCFILIISF